MKKSEVSSKQLFKKVQSTNKDLRLPEYERSVRFSESVIPPISVCHNYKKIQFKTREKELMEKEYPNPFVVPDRLRVTTRCVTRRKPKRDIPIIDEPLTVCDIDPEFFTMVEGRPIRSFYDIKSFMRDLRNVTLCRANAGYLKDKMLQIEAFFAMEQEEFTQVDRNFEKINRSFTKFAEENYIKTKYIQKLAKESEMKVAKKNEELEEYSFEFVKLRNQLINIVVVFKQMVTYKKFLLARAPRWWRKSHEPDCSKRAKLCTRLYAELQSGATETAAMSKRSARSLAQLQPEMYFTTPSQLISLLDDMSRQCLNYLEINTYYSEYLDKILMTKKRYKDLMMNQVTNMEYLINLFQNDVNHLEALCVSYKERFNDILEKEFYNLVTSYDSSMLLTCVKYVHSAVFGDKPDFHDSLSFLMTNIEKEYNELWKNLESLNHVVVKKAARQMFKEDNRMMCQAVEAHKVLKQYKVLCKSLRRSFEPSKANARWYN